MKKKKGADKAHYKVLRNKTAFKKESKKQETIFIDGDNHFDEGQKGIDQLSENAKVRAIFSQPGAKRKFDIKYGNRPNISSKCVKPGNQAVDNQIKTEVGQLLKKENQDISIVSQDKGFVKYGNRKENGKDGNSINVVKSVEDRKGKCQSNSFIDLLS